MRMIVTGLLTEEKERMQLTNLSRTVRRVSEDGFDGLFERGVERGLRVLAGEGEEFVSVTVLSTQCSSPSSHERDEQGSSQQTSAFPQPVHQYG